MQQGMIPENYCYQNIQYELATLHDYLNEQLLKAVDDYRNSHAAGHWVDSEGWQILKYGEGNHFTNHYDDAKKYPRTISMSFYLNDNYENGEICFKIKNHYISHKPKKGDVIVFPSKSPYFHAVRKASGSDRYMIRSFWQYDYSGSDEWLKNQKKHGKEEWYKMEKDRIKKERDYLTYSAERLHKFFGKDNGVYK